MIKIILNKPKTYTFTQLFKEFNVFLVQKLFQRNFLYFVYKINLIDLKSTYYNTRLDNNIDFPITRPI